tara:strand:- start:512 stop:1117 length:606 start_codon:yes stop_codon:yes gene_type:complete
MIGDDNEVKEVLLNWLKSKKDLYNNGKKAPVSAKHKWRETDIIPWKNLHNESVEAEFLVQAYIDSVFKEGYRPPLFCKGYEGVMTQDGETVKTETYWHPNAWEGIEVVKEVYRRKIDPQPYYDMFPHTERNDKKEWVVLEAQDNSLTIEVKTKKDFFYIKRIPQGLARAFRSFARQRNKLFPGVHVLLPEYNNNVYILKKD